MPFIKGQSGNPKGRNPRPAEEAYLKAVVKAMPKTRWASVLNRVATLAERGERWAVEFYADRIMGKPIQQVEASHTGEQKIIVEYVNPITDTSSTQEPDTDSSG